MKRNQVFPTKCKFIKLCLFFIYHHHTPITIYYEQSETDINLVNQDHNFDIRCYSIFHSTSAKLSSDVSCVVDDFISNLHILLCYETCIQNIYRWCMKSPLINVDVKCKNNYNNPDYVSFMEVQSFRIEGLPEGAQIIVAQSHFIKTVEDVAECLVNCVPNVKFGLAFCEASGACLVRHVGNDANLEILVSDYAYKLSAGHSLIILIRDAYPINILPRLKEVPEIVNIFCATANPIEIIFVQTNMGRAIIGIVDGFMPKGIETEKDALGRRQFLREIGYKF